MPVLTILMTTACNSNDESEEIISSARKQRVLTVTLNAEAESAAKSNALRTTQLVDKGESGLSATWEMGDVMTVYNKTAPAPEYETVKASSTTKNTIFTGMVDCEVDDVLRFFYPEVGTEGSVTGTAGNLTLDISNQKGTLEDIQMHYDFNYGEATVTAVSAETASANMGSTENLMAICKFTFKVGKEYMKDIRSIDISGVPVTANYTLSNRRTPTLTPSSPSTLHVATGGIDNTVYVALFPGSTTPSFTLYTTEGTYEGSLPTSTLLAGKFYNVMIELTRTGDAPVSGDFVVVCGIKWAKGNLQYDPVNGGDEGFMENWRIAPTQWDGVGVGSSVTVSKITSSAIHDCFKWGFLGDAAINYNSDGFYSFYQAPTGFDISKKLYINSIKPGFETDFEDANRGDLAYWASYGKYCMPRYVELNKLLNEASRQYGYIINEQGEQVYGTLFTNSNGEQIINTTAVSFTEQEIEQGLFLPCLSSICKTRSSQNGQVSVIVDKNQEYVGSTATSTDIYSIYVSGTATLKTVDSGTSPLPTTAYYYPIRPILCE